MFHLDSPSFGGIHFVFVGLCILFHPSNWVSTILNRQHVYQSQLSLKTALSGVSEKLLDEYTWWSVLQQGLLIFSSAWTVIYFRRKKKKGYEFAWEKLGLLNTRRIANMFWGCWVRYTLFSLTLSPWSYAIQSDWFGESQCDSAILFSGYEKNPFT